MGFFNLDVVFPLLKLQRYVCDDKILSAAPVKDIDNSTVFSNREDQVCCNGQHVFVQIWACLTCCVGIWDVQTVVMCLLINKGSAGNMCVSAEWRRQEISPWVTLISILFQCLDTLQSVLKTVVSPVSTEWGENILCIYISLCFLATKSKTKSDILKKKCDSIFDNNIQRPQDFFNCSCFPVQGFLKYFVLKMFI